MPVAYHPNKTIPAEDIHVWLFFSAPSGIRPVQGEKFCDMHHTLQTDLRSNNWAFRHQISIWLA